MLTTCTTLICMYNDPNVLIYIYFVNTVDLSLYSTTITYIGLPNDLTQHPVFLPNIRQMMLSWLIFEIRTDCY